MLVSHPPDRPSARPTARRTARHRVRRTLLKLWGGALAGLVVIAAPAAGQDIRHGVVIGTVRDAAGLPIAGAAVQITHVISGVRSRVQAGRQGQYRAEGLIPGTVEVRAEAIGFRPKRVRSVPVAPGTETSLDVFLVEDPPPVDRIDTEDFGTDQGVHFGLGQDRLLGDPELRRLPALRHDLSSIMDLASFAGDPWAPAGLPPILAGGTLDGFLALPLTHPAGSGSSILSGFAPRNGLAFVRLTAGPRDVEHLEVPGLGIHGTTRRGGPELRGDAYGSWSGDALWSSDFVDGEQPTLNSFWAGGSVGGPVFDGRGTFFVGGEGMRFQSARSPLVSSALAAVVEDRVGTDGTDAPWADELEAVTGAGRVDVDLSPRSNLMVRANLAVLRSSGGPASRPSFQGSFLPREDGAFNLAAYYQRTLRTNLRIEGGVAAGTVRTEFGNGEDGIPGSWFGSNASTLGPIEGLTGSVERSDLQLTATTHIRLPARRIKIGFSAWVPRYDHGAVPGTTGEVFFSDGSGPTSGIGWATRAVPPETSSRFTVVHGTLYGQMEQDMAPELKLTAGVRVGFESLQSDADSIPLLTELLGNIQSPSSYSSGAKFGGLLALDWRRSGVGAARAAVTVDHARLDPSVIGEVLSAGRGVTVARGTGQLTAWPDLPWSLYDEAPSVSLFGPDLQSPRVATAEVGGTASLTPGLTVGVTGTYRAAEFLMRRRDLNRPLDAVGVDQFGRPLYGDPVQLGSLMIAQPGSNQRFPALGNIWALDPDGWSEHKGATATAELRLHDRLDLFGSYTLSEVRDNLVGAGSGYRSAQLGPGLGEDTAWDEGPSDFDVRHRIAAGWVLHYGIAGGLDLTGTYRFRSGYPFTPGFVTGLDANADGAIRNDVSHDLGGLSDFNDATCDDATVDGFLARNSCRGPSSHGLDLRLDLTLATLSTGARAQIVLEAFNLLETNRGRIDTAVYALDPTGSITSDPQLSTRQIPYRTNAAFGSVIETATTGRVFRVGARVIH